MLKWSFVAFMVTFLLHVGGTTAVGDAITVEPKVRKIRLDYGASVTGVTPGKQIRVWIPVPPDNDSQTIEELATAFPGETQVGYDPAYGNKVLYFSCDAPSSGAISFSQSFIVERSEILGRERNAAVPALAADQAIRFLSANQRVPISGRPLELLRDIDVGQDPFKLARTLYDIVDDHVTYDKSRPGYGNGDSVWVCDSRTGNCTDFHSLFISLARAQGIPTKFEIGFPLPSERGSGSIAGYHCWAQFFVQGIGWVPVDISEADKDPAMKEYYFGNLTENRVAFSLGRDITLVPQQAGPPLNYFIYPYCEVDGAPWPAEKILLDVSFKDQ